MTPGEILDDIAPELVDATGKATHLELAEGQTGKVYGDQRNYAVALLAAHTLTVIKRSGISGPVQTIREGQLSISHRPGSRDSLTGGGGGSLSSTTYGSELVRLRSQLIMNARTVLV